MDPTLRPLSVSEYIYSLNKSLKSFRKSIVGEVFELSTPDSGHIYFTLKDKKDDAVIKCAMWRSTYKIQGLQIKNGMEIIITGHPEVYPVKGRLSFIVSSIEPVGEGKLKAAYDELKSELMKEGLFAIENKRTLPQFPQNVGIITSKNGAVIHDFIGNVGKCGFRFIFCDSRVEGKDALRDLLHALKVMATQDIEILIIMRGGGPMQSLAAFDNETLVREIVKFPVPVVAAIGHHLDVPLVALASDAHVSTPTAAASLLGKSWINGRYANRKLSQAITVNYAQVLQDTELTLQLKKETVSEAFQSLLLIFDSAKQAIKDHTIRVQATLPGLIDRINNLQKYILTGFQSKLITQYKALNMSDEIVALNDAIIVTAALIDSNWHEKVVRIYNFSLQSFQAEMKHIEANIHLRDPRTLLKYGYSILRKQGMLVKSIKNVTIGELLEVTLADGQVTSQVKKIKSYES